MKNDYCVVRASKEDFEFVCAIDDLDRKEFILESIEKGNCYAAKLDEKIVGFLILDRSFFSQYFISLLIVHHLYRRNGIGKKLMKFIENICPSNKLFTSTNESNVEMQNLLKSLGYEKTGCIENLDEGDPEIIYLRWLPSK